MVRQSIFLALLAGAVSFPVIMSHSSNSNSTDDPSWEWASNADLTPGNGSNFAPFPKNGATANGWAGTGADFPPGGHLHPIGRFSPNEYSVNMDGMGSAWASGVSTVSGSRLASEFFVPVSQLSEVIRFDVYPGWVKARWPRVSVVSSELNLQGMRVPLVTGTRAHDLSGSLTYYFDDLHQVQRIQFQGWTGDASVLVHFVTTEFGLKTRPTQTAGLYIRRIWGSPHSVLRLDHNPMVRRDDPHRQMAVFLELNHPRGRHPVSSLAQQAIQTP